MFAEGKTEILYYYSSIKDWIAFLAIKGSMALRSIAPPVYINLALITKLHYVAYLPEPSKHVYHRR